LGNELPIRATTVGLVLAALVSCSSPAPSSAITPTPVPAVAPTPIPAASPAPRRVLGYTEQRLLATDAALDPPAYPVRTNPDGSWLTVGAADWTAGFYAAALWRTYERTRDPAWRQRAETWQAGLAPETKHDNTDCATRGRTLRVSSWIGGPTVSVV
jgi:unsaturated chondroitin disaccharide hydrolase